MADRWMDERDREWRERDWRRSETYGRGGGNRGRADETRRLGEDRSWPGAADEGGESYEEQSRRRLARYDDEDYRGGADVTSGGYRPGLGPRRPGGGQPRFTSQDYAGRDYGRQPSAGQPGRREDDYRSAGRHDVKYGNPYGGGFGRDWADRQDRRADDAWESDREGDGSGDFLRRAGERISSWFRGDHLMHGSRDDEPGHYREDYGREARRLDRGHRGLGPKGYQRSDERISDEVHERLTDDPWLDASNIDVEVKSGEVTLSGHVENREAKHRAERLIEDLAGVGHVQNNLRVNPNASFTGAGRGFGSSALEEEMRRNARATDPGNNGVSGLSGRTSTGAAAERSSDPKKLG